MAKTLKEAIAMYEDLMRCEQVVTQAILDNFSEVKSNMTEEAAKHADKQYEYMQIVAWLKELDALKAGESPMKAAVSTHNSGFNEGVSALVTACRSTRDEFITQDEIAKIASKLIIE